MELNGKTAIITGSSGKLGSAIAISLAQAGCDCICHYQNNQAQAEKNADLIRQAGRKALIIKADFTKASDIDEFFESCCRFSIPQILINSAADFERLPLQDVTFDNMQQTLSLNLIAPLLLAKHFAKKIQSKFPDTQSVVGKIINICDVGAIRPWSQYSVYCSSKAGLLAATKSLAKELAPAICVNAVAPGIVTWPEDFDQPQKLKQLNHIPLRREATLEEFTHSVKFLLENDYITGQILNVDGGRCI